MSEFEKAIKELERQLEYQKCDRGIHQWGDSTIDAVKIAVRGLKLLDDADTRLAELLAQDKRTLEKPAYSAQNDYFFDGVHSAYKIVHENLVKVDSIN